MGRQSIWILYFEKMYFQSNKILIDMALRHTLAALVPRTTALRIKFLRQYLYRLKTGKKKIVCAYQYKYIKKPHTHVFFGYYDISPFNIDTDEIIYNNLVEHENKMHLMLSSLSSGEEREIAETRAWNWQQGCRLRWMPNTSREVIFNDFNGSDYFSRILNVESKEERIINAPLYDITQDGHYGLSIDFDRLGVKRPGYGYTCRQYNETEHNMTEEGIELVDLTTNKKQMILTYLDIQQIFGCNTGNLKNNYLNHLCFSPSGRQFLFFWLTVDESFHKAFLLVHNLDTHETKLLENQEIVSHYVWKDNDNIICAAVDNMKRWHYYIYNISTGQKRLLNPSVLNVDGHPSIFSDDIILTDTYPDLMGFQKLYFANTNKGGSEKILEIYSNCIIEGEKRTDLHPRLNSNKSLVCIDSNQNDFRNLLIISLC